MYISKRAAEKLFQITAMTVDSRLYCKDLWKQCMKIKDEH